MQGWSWAARLRSGTGTIRQQLNRLDRNRNDSGTPIVTKISFGRSRTRPGLTGSGGFGSTNRLSTPPTSGDHRSEASEVGSVLQRRRKKFVVQLAFRNLDATETQRPAPRLARPRLELEHPELEGFRRPDSRSDPGPRFRAARSPRGKGAPRLAKTPPQDRHDGDARRSLARTPHPNSATRPEMPVVVAKNSTTTIHQTSAPHGARRNRRTTGTLIQRIVFISGLLTSPVPDADRSNYDRRGRDSQATPFRCSGRLPIPCGEAPLAWEPRNGAAWSECNPQVFFRLNGPGIADRRQVTPALVSFFHTRLNPVISPCSSLTLARLLKKIKSPPPILFVRVLSACHPLFRCFSIRSRPLEGSIPSGPTVPPLGTPWSGRRSNRSD